MTLPRDFLAEVESELQDARDNFSQNRDRLAALEELREVAVAVVSELNRPITVFDVIYSARERHERRRRTRLVRQLRTPPGQPPPP